MYTLYGIDAILRITAALLVLFVAVPALARPRPRDLDRLEWFWWCAACGTVLLTLVGQILTLANIFSALTLLLAIAALIVIVRAKVSGVRPLSLVQRAYRVVVLMSLNVLERRVNLPRRLRRFRRHAARWLAQTFESKSSRWHAAGWIGVVLIAAIARFYRPFVTANLGFSDTYVHLYLMRLLEEGRQVDPAWGPYPRGMHFLLGTIHELTNVDLILLMNFFGPVSGVLMTLAVADAARRLTGRTIAGLLTGFLFATMTGGITQYFVMGGSMATDDIGKAQAFVQQPYPLDDAGEFDVLMTVFHRQTATLPQELALVFLFPAVMFLRRSHWSGFVLCTAAIAAIHPGVAVPLVLLCAVTVIAMRVDIRRAMVAGAIGIAIGSTWMLGYIRYPYFGKPDDIGTASSAGSTALYYFPLFRFLGGEELARIVTYVAITPFLVATLGIAAVLLAYGIRTKRRELIWIALATFVFFLTHVASRWGLPEIVEVRRNASWFAMTLAILLGVTIALIPWRVRMIASALLVVWLVRVPLVQAHEKLINYSGYGATAYAVLEIQRKFEPFSWTLITYGQEYPMVLGKGFHLPAADFLERYDPAQPALAIPTKYVFIAVEKNPHPFQINTWSRRFTRAEVEQRLQTWCFLYQLSHRNMRVFMDDENVRVYMIERTDAETRAIAREARS